MNELRLNETREICNECGNSVKLGSGRFVNRIPDLNSSKERQDMGKPYPLGDYICADCESSYEAENPLLG